MAEDMGAREADKKRFQKGTTKLQQISTKAGKLEKIGVNFKR
jgi:hypothetical protein